MHACLYVSTSSQAYRDCAMLPRNPLYYRPLYCSFEPLLSRCSMQVTVSQRALCRVLKKAEAVLLEPL